MTTPTLVTTPTLGTHRVRKLVGGLLLVICLSGCIVWGKPQFGLSLGHGLYGWLYQQPTAQVIVLRAWKGSNGDTLAYMKREVVFGNDIKERLAQIGYVVSDLNYFFDPSQVDDFGEALADASARPNRCLVMHRNPANLLGDRHNWTWGHPGGDCRVGEPFKIP